MHALMAYYQRKEACRMAVKEKKLKAEYQFSDFKTDSAGLVPVVVQEYGTGEVLMLAYMNEEAYQTTLEKGLMTYYSRSRQELWTKGMTSGHFQEVMSLSIDCDNDTILAEVVQTGAACHTGHHSCFYRSLAVPVEENNE